MRFMLGFVSGVVTFTGLSGGLRADVAQWAGAIRESLANLLNGIVA